MVSRHQKTVTTILQDYADRGVFGGLSVTEGAKSQYEFKWLYNQRFVVIFDEAKEQLQFKNCFVAISPRSDEHMAIKEFIESRYSKELPAHRRIDKARAEVTCQCRGGSLSVSMKVHRNQYKYATGKLVNLIHETFLMIDQCFAEYLYEHYGLPEE